MELFSENLTAEYIANNTSSDEHNKQLKEVAAEVEHRIHEAKSKGLRVVIIKAEVLKTCNIRKIIVDELSQPKRNFMIRSVADDDIEMGEMWDIEIKW